MSLLEIRKQQIEIALGKDKPLLSRYGESDGDVFNAQQILEDSKEMNDFWKHRDMKGKMLNEVFQISKVNESERTDLKLNCTGSCYKIDLYNYALNGSILATVDIERKMVIDFRYYAQMQPLIPKHLGDLAFEIAKDDSQVQNHMGCVPTPDMSRMSATKTALNKTKCQRSEHLCVAPTFVNGEKALWAIVDLTDLELVGVKWTEVGNTGGAISERALQNEIVMSCYCDVENELNRDQWSFKYKLTRSDGLEVADIRYNGKKIFQSVKLVDWHVSYSQIEGFGYSDAIGCPEFSQAAVIATTPPRFESLVENGDTIGFSLIQDYYSQGWPTPCSYNYQQQFQFFKTGSFRPMIGSLGRGCGTDGIYRPVTRIALAGDNYTFERRNEEGWTVSESESWFRENEAYNYSDKTIMARCVTANDTISIEANRGQFGDGSKGDNAYVYITKFKPGEGSEDLPTIGPCCNTDHRQGPDKFIDDIPESLKQTEVVIWYVPEIHNDGRKGHEFCWAESVIENGVTVAKVYPCFSGPKFIL